MTIRSSGANSASSSQLGLVHVAYGQPQIEIAAGTTGLPLCDQFGSVFGQLVDPVGL